jgi:S-DNA-T family DNA segregation ATPase FtsK/SpoIIIE
VIDLETIPGSWNPNVTKKYSKQTVRPESGPAPENQTSWLDISLRFLTHFQSFAWDIAGVAALAFALMTFLALFNLTGGVFLTWWAGFLLRWLGWGSISIVLIAGVAGLLLFRRRANESLSVRWGRILALEVTLFAGLALLAVLGGMEVQRAEAGLDGGLIGWGLAELLGLLIQPNWLLGVVLGMILLVAFALGTGLPGFLAQLANSQAEARHSSSYPGAGTLMREEPGSGDGVKTDEQLKRKVPQLPAEFRKKFKIQVAEQGSARSPVRDERLPGLDLLVTEQTQKPDERNINLTAGLIEKTLAEFGIPAKVVGFRVGPTVTQFAVEPGFVEKPGNTEDENVRQKVRVAQISALSRDLALALSASRLRIEAPVPGRPYVGIEVPNIRSSLVRLRPILESESFYRFGSPLTIALGRDVSGQAVVADLASMPHLLIAGTTGSGKSVCIAALTACLVMNNTPEDLRLVMIDPKMVELVRFNGLPHLYGKVETNLERILTVLRWTVAEMDRRYKLLEASHSRNLDTYNRKIRKRKGERPLPHIVVMIDELADLMMSAPEQTEPTLVRLAQMARATGIHLVVATQRPSTDVVTGLIKANFPARISFAVASSIDSRVILDTVGAESLLGRGDLLFLPPEAGSPIRAQGAMVTDQEIERVITFWQKAHAAEDQEQPPWEQLLEEEALLSEKDDLIERAIAVVRESQRASASLLQRRLRIGYPRAARLIDELEELGIIGPALGGGREREVLAGPEEEDEIA